MPEKPHPESGPKAEPNPYVNWLNTLLPYNNNDVHLVAARIVEAISNSDMDKQQKRQAVESLEKAVKILSKEQD